MNLLKASAERDARARENRRYSQGVVVATDLMRRTATVHVGALDCNGNDVFLQGVPYPQQLTPQIGDTVTLDYAHSHPTSVYVAGNRLGSQNGTGGVIISGAVTSIQASGQPALQGAVVMAAGTGESIAQSGQTITYSATPHALLDANIDSDTLAHAPVAGDVLIANGTPKWTGLGIGSANQVLTVVSGAPAWAALPAGSPHNLLDGSVDQDTTATAAVRGDLVVANSTPKWTGLALGAAGKVLGSNGTDALWTSRGCMLVLCAAFTPAGTGADVAEIPVPYNPDDGTSITWNIRRIGIRVQTAGGAPAATFEYSTAAGAFSANTIGTVTLASGANEGTVTSGFTNSTVASGNKIRFNVGTLATATNWTCWVELGS